MPKLSYAFEAGGEKRLTLTWKGGYRNMTVTLDGSPLGVIADQKALRAGQEFRLMDGSILKVQLVNKISGSELQVLRNGQPLPGSSSDPQAKLKTAAYMVFFIAGLNLVLGILSVLLKSEFLQAAGIGIFSIIFGLVFLLLGFFVWRRSSVALILAIVIFALDGILGIVLAVSQGYTPATSGLLMRIVLLIPMIQGVGAIKALKASSHPGVLS